MKNRANNHHRQPCCNLFGEEPVQQFWYTELLQLGEVTVLNTLCTILNALTSKNVYEIESLLGRSRSSTRLRFFENS